MEILILLLGAVLGRFFKVLVLVPACALVLAAVLVGPLTSSTTCCVRSLNPLGWS